MSSLIGNDVELWRGHGQRRKAVVRASVFKVGAGEIMAVVGESGVGKSTLAAAIAGGFASPSPTRRESILRGVTSLVGSSVFGEMAGTILLNG